MSNAHGTKALDQGSGSSRSNEHSSLLPSSTQHNAHEEEDEGESGRSGFQLSHFLAVSWRSSNLVSMLVNVLWPFVPAAFALRYTTNLHLWVFAIAYVAMIPAANLLGFAGQEFARKMPKVAGILIETAVGSVTEIILFILLIVRHSTEVGNGDERNMVPIIQAAILGSMLTNLLLCLGLCFIAGGIASQGVQKFHGMISEVGNSLLLVAAFGLLVPTAFYSALKSETVSRFGFLVQDDKFTLEKLQADILSISRATSIALIIAFAAYIWFSTRSQHSLFDEVIRMDESNDADHEADMAKPKYTMSEALIALAFSVMLVTWLLLILVENIEHVVASGVPDQFLGLILLPLVEKAAEHLTAIDEAWGM